MSIYVQRLVYINLNHSFIAFVCWIGLAYLHYHLSIALGSRHSQDYLEDALEYLEEPLHHLKRKRSTFLCGDGGPLALGAVIYHKLGQKNKSLECIKRLDIKK